MTQPPAPLPADLNRIVALAHDVAFYRMMRARDMGEAAWIELSHTVANLPEAERILPAPPRGLLGRWWAWKMERALSRGQA